MCVTRVTQLQGRVTARIISTITILVCVHYVGKYVLNTFNPPEDKIFAVEKGGDTVDSTLIYKYVSVCFFAFCWNECKFSNMFHFPPENTVERVIHNWEYHRNYIDCAFHWLNFLPLCLFFSHIFCGLEPPGTPGYISTQRHVHGCVFHIKITSGRKSKRRVNLGRFLDVLGLDEVIGICTNLQ